jgi:hypothetical protein
MLTKKSVSVMAAMLALGVAGPTVAMAHDDNNDASDTPAASATTSAVDNGTLAEQESGEQGDVENADLASQVEAVDGANDDGANDENEVGDGEDGQIDDGASGDSGD